MKNVNKTSIAAVSGAAVTILGIFWKPDGVTPDQMQVAMQSLQTILTAALVWWVANR